MSKFLFLKLKIVTFGYSGRNVQFLRGKMSKFWFFKVKIVTFGYSSRNVQFCVRKNVKIRCLTGFFDGSFLLDGRLLIILFHRRLWDFCGLFLQPPEFAIILPLEAHRLAAGHQTKEHQVFQQHLPHCAVPIRLNRVHRANSPL